MFDPTAYENMKVVLEGAVYDRDLDGEIAVVDRNDTVNLAKLSRTFDITFSLKNKNFVKCSMALTARLENFAAELLPEMKLDQKAGAQIIVRFLIKHQTSPMIDQKIRDKLEEIWGKDREFKHLIFLDPFGESNEISKEITIHFRRIITEEHMDDLLEMVDYAVHTIEQLQGLIGREKR